MIAIILAAGSGKRLKEYANNKPKCMIELDNIPLLTYTLYSLINNNIKNVIIAVGYRKNTIINHFGSNFFGLKINYVFNSNYNKTGSMYSLSVVYNKYNKLLKNRNIIILESDIVYSPSAIKTILRSKYKNVMLAVKARDIGDDVYIFTNENKNLKYLGKKIHSSKISNLIPSGESSGISKFSSNFLDKLIEVASKDYINGNLTYYYEKVVLKTVKNNKNLSVKVDFHPEIIWGEIDTIKDLNYVRNFIFPKLKNEYDEVIKHIKKNDEKK